MSTTLARPSQCDRVLSVLRDGHRHSIEEIHERAGTMRLNSRVAELRSRGHNIVCTRDDGTYSYRLLGGASHTAEGAPPSELILEQLRMDGYPPSLIDPAFRASWLRRIGRLRAFSQRTRNQVRASQALAYAIDLEARLP